MISQCTSGQYQCGEACRHTVSAVRCIAWSFLRLYRKPSSYWCAILKISGKSEGPKREDDFLWIKCHGIRQIGPASDIAYVNLRQRVNIQKIRDQFRNRTNRSEFVLIHQGNIPDVATVIGDLDVHGDRLVVLEAISITEWQSRRQPLIPTNYQTRRFIPAHSDDFIQPSKRSLPDPKTVVKQEAATFQDENDVAHRAGLQNEMLLQPGQKFPGSFSKPQNQLPQFTTTSKPQSHLSSGDGGQQKERNFQLQALLKDATPEMLESSVEEGVKLLYKLKVPMVTKMSDSLDAGQWIQQIGACVL